METPTAKSGESSGRVDCHDGAEQDLVVDQGGDGGVSGVATDAVPLGVARDVRSEPRHPRGRQLGRAEGARRRHPE